MDKPLIVYVSGAPGSGKTTLARLIAEQLYVLCISSDLVHGGVALSNPEHNRAKTITDVFVPTIVELAQKGVSFVVDQVLQKGTSEIAVIDKLRPYATIVNIHTVCANPIERYKDKVIHSDLPKVIERREQLLERVAYHEDNLDKTSKPLELGLPVLVVNTDADYNPNLNEIMSFIQKHYVG